MGTQEILTKLLGQALVQRVCKFGGQHVGPIGNINIIESVLSFFAVMGRPAGLVFSAPQGFTESLRQMFILSGSGHQGRAIEQFGLAMDGLHSGWTSLRDELVQAVPLEKMEDWNTRILIVDAEVVQQIGSFKMQIESIFRSGSQMKPDCAEAKVLSMGERSFGEIVMRPLCRILTEFFGMNFVYLDPIHYVVSKRQQEGCKDLDPDILTSATNLRDHIAGRQKWTKGGRPITFVMPGFYLAINKGWQVGTMPFNGSDISAYILSLAFGLEPIELVYIKRVVGGTPVDIKSLIDQQDASVGADGKKSELVATFVLRQLLARGQDLQLYNTVTGTFHRVPATVEVSTH